MLQSLMDLQNKMDHEHKTEKIEGSKCSARRKGRSSSGSSESEASTWDSSSSYHRDKRKMNYRNSSRDEFKNAIPPSCNGEINTHQEVEAWLLGMKKYFKVQDYLGNMKSRVAIFNLNGNGSIWW